jgi:hydrogenase maturation protein HypF
MKLPIGWKIKQDEMNTDNVIYHSQSQKIFAFAGDKPVHTIEILIEGLVQGVGFRPFIAQCASNRSIQGKVLNSGGQVEIVAIGTAFHLSVFVRDILLKSPKNSLIHSLLLSFEGKKTLLSQPMHPDEIQKWLDAALSDFQDYPADHDRNEEISNSPSGFEIVESRDRSNGILMPPPDLSICDDCLAEIHDEANRRYRHPFNSCTVCGPRYSILEQLPYDRCNTSMNAFEMCPACMSEYMSTADRRFHAQTVSCHHCGPQLILEIPSSSMDINSTRKDEALKQSIDLLKDGKLLAIKGVGGYHLMCLASASESVLKMRLLKNRDKKPFAVMFPHMKSIREHCHVAPAEEDLLHSAAHPIVLLKSRNGQDISPAVSAESRYIGAFLPYTALHSLILSETGPLVATSANLSGYPIIADDAAMKIWLEKGLDGVLYHERAIVVPQDDSVAQMVHGAPQLLRRARGFAPLAFYMNHHSQNSHSYSNSCIGFGGQQKASYCIVSKNQVYVSEYLGDLADIPSFKTFKSSLFHLKEVLHISHSTNACDKHPRYESTHLAYSQELPPVTVQHHHAHIASVLAENQSLKRVIGVSFDGTGYGDDESVWGGEFLICEKASMKRVGCLKPIRMIGGDSSVEEGWKSLLCHLYDIFGSEIPHMITIAEEKILYAALDKKINTLLSSSVGRLFDAVSALLGYSRTSSYEGELAIVLENGAWLALEDEKTSQTTTSVLNGEGLGKFELTVNPQSGLIEANPGNLLKFLLVEKTKGTSRDILALYFHLELVAMVLDMIEVLSLQYDTRDIVLSGGVFQNRLFTESLMERLENRNYRVSINRTVPPNDGGICLGQAWIAMQRQQEE